MSHWIAVVFAAACVLWVLLQTRMYFVYTGRVQSATVEPTQSTTLIAAAVKDVWIYLSYATILLLASWPRLLTYFALVWLLAASIDAVLGWFGKGVQVEAGILMRQTPKGARHFLIVETFGIGIRALIFAALVVWVGF